MDLCAMADKRVARTDVVVIGAGAAGLAAASFCRQRGVRTVILEARDRIGGRVFTVRDRRSPLPIELGAEFLHGAAEEVREIADTAGLTLVDVEGQRWASARGHLSRIDDFWKRLDRILGQAEKRRSPDRSLAEFLAEAPGGKRFAADRILAREFIEGFHAAEEQRLARVLAGYDAVIAELARSGRADIRLNHIVTAVDWSPGRVEVRATLQSGQEVLVRAAAAIVTVPLPLLQAKTKGKGAILFLPEITATRAAAECAAMGHVQKISILLDSPIHEIIPRARGEKLEQLAFVQARGVRIPVWWTSYPLRSGMMVGWAGGPAALGLEARPALLRDEALHVLAVSFGIDTRTIRRHLVALRTHDWSRDPFARGAYSYSLVGGSDAGERLSRPVRSTLFFAGEAANKEGRTGTVHGAIASGYYAGGQAFRAISRV
jgi:monoamine oxidase